MNFQFKLGQHHVRFAISGRNDDWDVQQQIGLEDAWDDEVLIGTYPDRRKAKNAMHHRLNELRADRSYY